MNLLRIKRNKRLWLPVAVVCCVLCYGLVRGEADTPPERGVTPVRIPFETYGGEIIVPVSIGGSRAINCILDTGMTGGVFIMDPGIGRELGLKYTQQVMVGGAGEGEPRYAELAHGVDFEIAGVAFRDTRVLVLTEAPPFMDPRIEGIVGKTIFDAYTVEIDFKNAEVILHDPVSFDPAGAGDPFSLDFQIDKPFVGATVRIDNSADIPVSLVVDLGAGHALSLNRGQEPSLPTPDRTIFNLLGTGMKGDIHGRQGRINRLQIGRFVMEGVVTSFPDNTDEAGLGPYARNGNLGLGVLERFIVTFDYANDRMYLRPNEEYGDPFESNMAGIVLRHRVDNGLRVYYVRKYSPAFKAGIEKDDVVLSINGRAAAEYNGVALKALFTKDGETVSLTVRRGERLFDVALTLEREI